MSTSTLQRRAYLSIYVNVTMFTARAVYMDVFHLGQSNQACAVRAFI